MVPKLLVVGAAVTAVAFSEAAESPLSADGRFGLACVGFMVAAGQEHPGSRIVADGVVDLLEMRVRGLGIGSVPIVSATAEAIRFGSSPVKTVGSHTIAGYIDRTSGETRVVVWSAKAPRSVVIAMTLDCRSTPGAGH